MILSSIGVFITGFGITVLVFILGFLYIKSAYRKFDRDETMKENNELWKKRIREALKYFKDVYNTDFDHSVYDNVKTKTDFILKLIDRKNDTGAQNVNYNRLFSMLYETGVRLKTKYDDVNYITAPLNNMYQDLVTEHLDYIKENTDL